MRQEGEKSQWSGWKENSEKPSKSVRVGQDANPRTCSKGTAVKDSAAPVRAKSWEQNCDFEDFIFTSVFPVRDPYAGNGSTENDVRIGEDSLATLDTPGQTSSANQKRPKLPGAQDCT
jgi:hypothetical protein